MEIVQMATLEQARAAKAVLGPKFRNEEPWKNYYQSIGIVDPEGTQDQCSVSVGLRLEAPPGIFPESHDGVPIKTHVDGIQELQ